MEENKNKITIACVVPTIRPECMKKFKKAWQPLFEKHNCTLITVWDGEDPEINVNILKNQVRMGAKEIMGEYVNALSNFNGGIRNLGFAFIFKYMKNVEIIITLDDDEVPVGDPIQDHIDALNMRVPISWMSTASEYMRGFPYKIRNEAEVVLSHGIWEGVADWDAPTQLVLGNRSVTFPRCPIPKGIYFPMCCMNLAFKRKILPYVYHFPASPELNVGRVDDIFAGIIVKREIDKNGWAAVTGYAKVNHQRASDVYKNLQKESLGIELMETFWQGDEKHPYFDVYHKKYALWKEFIEEC